MRFVSERDVVRAIPERWRTQYPQDCEEGSGHERYYTYQTLLGMCETASANDVAQIIDRSWTLRLCCNCEAYIVNHYLLTGSGGDYAMCQKCAGDFAEVVNGGKQRQALRNCLALAGRHKDDGDWAHIVRFCGDGGVVRSPFRGLDGPSNPPQTPRGANATPPNPTGEQGNALQQNQIRDSIGDE